MYHSKHVKPKDKHLIKLKLQLTTQMQDVRTVTKDAKENKIV